MQRSRTPGSYALLPHAFEPNRAALLDVNLLRHELRAPLAGMLGLAELMSAMDLPGRAGCWLATLQACGQQMASLIDRALRPDFQAGDERQGCMVDGLQFLESLVLAHWPAAVSGGTRLVLACHPGAIGHWQTDAVALRQAMDNLLANALRFSRDGWILLEARCVTAPGTVTGALELSVENNGALLASNSQNLQDRCEFADRAYRLFSQGHGLQVVEQFCRRWQGALHRQQSAKGATRYSLTLAGAIASTSPRPRPFRPCLLDSLGCILLLDYPQQRAVSAMLSCLEINFELIESTQVPEPKTWPASWVLIASHALLPARYPTAAETGDGDSIWIMAKMPDGPSPGLYCQPLPEPLLMPELQNALLRCRVMQGLAIRHDGREGEGIVQE